MLWGEKNGFMVGVQNDMCALSFFPGEWVLLCKKDFNTWWLKPMTNIYYLIVFVD